MQPDHRMTDAHQFFCETLERYEKPLIRYALNYVGQVEDARDIVQDVFLRLSQSLMLVDRSRIAPWLFTVCKNRSTDHLRKHHRLIAMETETLDLEESPTRRPGEDLEMQEDVGTMHRLLAKLPEKQREAIRLKFIAGLSYKEISDAMSTSIGNVGYLIHHGIQAMREQWQTQESQPHQLA
jgi:RNA polymerase sigma factor (sigma-70 family)